MKRLAILLALLLASPCWATDRYLRSTDGSDASDGLTWANAHATLADALTASSAGDRIFVSDNHAETQASAMTLLSPGTAAAPIQILCVDDSAEPPTALATTATVSTTGANSINITGGYAFVHGVTIQAGSAAGGANILVSSAADYGFEFDHCGFTLNNTVNSSSMRFGLQNSSRPQNFVFNECTFTFGAAGQDVRLQYGEVFVIRGGSLAGTAPTVLFETLGNNSPVILDGVDLSIMGSGTSLVNLTGPTPAEITFLDCKLGASVALTTGTTIDGNLIRFINCDSGDTNYNYERISYRGTISEETTIVRTGGSSDGTTPVSRKFVSSANTSLTRPLQSDWVTWWNESTSEMTVTAEVVTDNVTLTDAEAWIEVEYLGTSGFPQSVLITDRVAEVLDTPANQTSSSETWTTTGLGTPIKQALAVTFTPAEKGPIRARVCVAKASATVYVDQLYLSDSGRQWQAAGSYINEGAGGNDIAIPGLSPGGVK